MQLKSISGLVAGAAVASAQCAIPVAPLPTSIPAPFRVEVQNITRPDVHGKHMNLYEAGGGDQHLFIGPVGNLTLDLTLVNGVINWLPGGVRAVIGGEFSEIDHTTKMFMTERGDPKAVFAPTYACNPDVPTETQVELSFVGWEGEPAGGWICVRNSFDGSHEFRYSPPGNDLVDVDRECVKVTLVVRPADETTRRRRRA
ncbi:hypothetical protein B0T16DRAFT_430285 [Cercophora newfieldiana]|uniref:DUF7909 domain-containing protein n=1 Tax=Cercophora newfieldiana TaxID=92897 RepID=A0AA39Y2V2_9PEZI|nr:hypothetical protein B0T16DRAFT_430285 [Cercophora newfieldiana]